MSTLDDVCFNIQKLRRLSLIELTSLAEELRQELISSVSVSGGHFASSLGVLELTLALHYVFDTPGDRLIWDVGHQAYFHKMITGRLGRLHSIRKQNGISGFLKRGESEFDTFGAGHAGTSISAALGLRIGMDKELNENYVVSVIGDGALTAGMAFEALNHAGAYQPKNFIVILNDNSMSIAENVGALHLRSLDKDNETGLNGFFNNLGFEYQGPIDGHDLGKLVRVLNQVKAAPGPQLIHLKTIKGKGHHPAEGDPVAWHGISPKSNSSGTNTQNRSAEESTLSYTTIFSRTLLELCKKDRRVLAITAAMPGGTGLDLIAREMPESFIDVGISEQHAVTLAAGLACAGMKPVVAIYSTFLQRGYDQLVHDVCIQKLPVIFAIDRAGLVGPDGETHQGVFDLAYLRALPNLTIMSPRNGAELRNMLHSAFTYNGPVAIRYPRSNTRMDLSNTLNIIKKGEVELISSGEEALIVALGPTVSTAINVRDRLEAEYGYSVGVINARFVKPLDSEFYLKHLSRYKIIFTLEDHSKLAGFGSALQESLNDVGINLPIKSFGVPDYFMAHASQEEQMKIAGYDEESVYKFLLNSLRGLENHRLMKQQNKLQFLNYVR